jgi:hypothetical protein
MPFSCDTYLYTQKKKFFRHRIVKDTVPGTRIKGLTSRFGLHTLVGRTSHIRIYILQALFYKAREDLSSIYFSIWPGWNISGLIYALRR